MAWTRNETLDQDLIVSGSVDNTVRVWAWSVAKFSTTITITSPLLLRDDRSALLEPKWTFEGHQLGIVSVATDSSGTGMYHKSMFPQKLPCLSLSAVVASSGLDGYIKTWDLSSGEGLKSIDGGPVDVWTLAFSPDSQVSPPYPLLMIINIPFSSF